MAKLAPQIELNGNLVQLKLKYKTQYLNIELKWQI